MAEDQKSSRTKLIEETKVDEDQSGIKNLVKKGAVAISNLLDRAGITQEKEYEGKSKEELIKKRSGGSVSSASKRADGIAQRGKTKGRFV